MRIVFMGTPQAAVPSLEKLLEDGHEVVAVWTQPDRPAGRGNKLTSPPVKVSASEKGIPVYQPLKIKTTETLDLFRSHKADVAIVVAYGRILPDEYLTAFPKGAINVHFSLLPKYRGAAPVNWAIVNGEKVTGVTTMQMDAGLDTGDILLAEEVAIGENENSIQLMERLSFVGAELIAKTLNQLDETVPQKQNNSLASYAPIMKKEDGLIDWSMRAEDIVNRIRGFQPFPRSYSFADGKRLVIWAAETVASEGAAEPGAVIEAKGDRIVVACGQGTVSIAEAQIEGKSRMTARDLINGGVIKPGQLLSA